MSGPSIRAVVVTHDSASDVARSLPALAAQLRPGDELVVVDTASADDSVSAARRAAPDATVVELGANAGFAGGAVAGAADARTDLLWFLNPDAVVEPGCVDALRAAAAEHPSWAAWQALVLLPDGEHANVTGGVVHWLGIAWAGGYGERADGTAAAAEVGWASGSALVVRRDAWEQVGGFEPAYFMYGEDVDLALRLRLAGHGIGVVPGARVRHDYAFEKGDYKWFHLERNRWWTVLATYPAPLLALTLPALLAFEVALLAVAARGGWLPAKLRAQRAVLADLPRILARRRRTQAARAVDAATFARALSDTLDSPFLGPAASIGPLVTAQRLYWTLVRRLLSSLV